MNTVRWSVIGSEQCSGTAHAFSILHKCTVVNGVRARDVSTVRVFTVHVFTI